MHAFACAHLDYLETQHWPGVPCGRTHMHSDTGTVTANPPENRGRYFLQEPRNREGTHSVTHIYPTRKFRSRHGLNVNKP